MQPQTLKCQASFQATAEKKLKRSDEQDRTKAFTRIEGSIEDHQFPLTDGGEMSDSCQDILEGKA